MHNADDIFDDCLVYEGALPFRWQPLTTKPDAAQLDWFNRENETTLELLHALTAHPGSPPEEEVTESAELARLEHKLDLLLGMFSELLARTTDYPPARELRLSAHGMSWPLDDALQAGQFITGELFLDPACPRALKLPMQVLQLPEEGTGKITMGRFVGLDEQVHDGLERAIFQFHRRLVAQARREGDEHTSD